MKTFAVIVENQKMLLASFRKIEHANGFTQIPLELPIDPASFTGQAELRRLAGCIYEELCEAVHEYDRERMDECKVEMIDAMHFIAEFVLTLGWESQELVLNVEPLPYPSFTDSLISLGLSLHYLKNKPWKQTARPLDYGAFKASFERFLSLFFQLCTLIGINDEELLEQYEAKAAINRERIATGV